MKRTGRRGEEETTPKSQPEEDPGGGEKKELRGTFFVSKECFLGGGCRQRKGLSRRRGNSRRAGTGRKNVRTEDLIKRLKGCWGGGWEQIASGQGKGSP